MLFGEYEHQLDEKNRLRLPAKLKNKLGDKYIITKGTNGCLFVFSQDSINEIINEKLKSVPISDIKAQKSVRMLFSSGYEAEEDNQGRLILPANLREFAGLGKDIVSIGVGNRMEIWDKDRWTEYQKSSQDFDQVLMELSQYGV